jgi:hypothetical protein
MLILATLKHREQVSDAERQAVPVPVMFTLHDWSPGTQRVQDWLVVRLQQTYPMLAGKSGATKAATLLAAGKVAVILDGLDEIPAELRSVALRALSQQATFRLVVLTRSAEMADAASHGPLEGAAAVELQDVDAVTAARYLTRVQVHPAPRGWRELTSRLRRTPDGSLAQALRSPLTLTLVRDTYRSGDDIRELLDFCDTAGGHVSSEDIVDHLLDRVLPVAYAQRPGDPPLRYNLQTAQHALGCLAAQMNQDGTRDLQWWRIRDWAPAAPRVIATGLTFGIGIGLAGGFTLGYTFGLALGAAAALAFGFLFRFGSMGPSQTTPRTLRQALRLSTLAAGLPVGLAVGLGAGLAAGLAVGLPGTVPAGLAAGLALGFAAGLGAGLARALFHPSADNAAPLSPRTSWRSNRASGLAFGLVFGLVFGLAVGLAGTIAGGFAVGLALGLTVGFAIGLTAALASGLTAGIAAGLTSGIAVGLAAGLTGGLSDSPASWLAFGLAGGLALGLAGGLMYTLRLIHAIL